MAWRRPGDKPLSEPMLISLLTHICVTRPQCEKKRNAHLNYDHFHLPQKNSVKLSCEHICSLPNDMLHMRKNHLPSIKRNMDGWQTTQIKSCLQEWWQVSLNRFITNEMWLWLIIHENKPCIIFWTCAGFCEPWRRETVMGQRVSVWVKACH